MREEERDMNMAHTVLHYYARRPWGITDHHGHYRHHRAHTHTWIALVYGGQPFLFPPLLSPPSGPQKPSFVCGRGLKTHCGNNRTMFPSTDRPADLQTEQGPPFNPAAVFEGSEIENPSTATSKVSACSQEDFASRIPGQ